MCIEAFGLQFLTVKTRKWLSHKAVTKPMITIPVSSQNHMYRENKLQKEKKNVSMISPEKLCYPKLLMMQNVPQQCKIHDYCPIKFVQNHGFNDANLRLVQ